MAVQSIRSSKSFTVLAFIGVRSKALGHTGKASTGLYLLASKQFRAMILVAQSLARRQNDHLQIHSAEWRLA